MYADASKLIEANTADGDPDIPMTSSQGAVFDANLQQTDDNSRACHMDNDSDGDVLDMYDNEGDDLSISPLSELTYFDADTQQFAAFTALNQVLLHVGEHDILACLPRNDDDSSEFGLDTYILEIIEPLRNDYIATSQTRLTNETTLDCFDFKSARSPWIAKSQQALTWPDAVQSITLHDGKSKNRRPQLSLETRLEPVPEDLEGACMSPILFRLAKVLFYLKALRISLVVTFGMACQLSHFTSRASRFQQRLYPGGIHPSMIACSGELKVKNPWLCGEF
ncbi:uncharacterized protein K460DRAFT_362112, partial [Cucurbitaria berberidis CBS 394.84]